MAGDGIEIRPYRAGDEAAVIALVQVLQNYERRFSPHHVDGDAAYGRWYFDRLMDDLAENDGVLLVAAADDEVCGFAAGIAEEDAEAQSQMFLIAELVVAEHLRGRGLGTRLIAVIEETARARGFARTSIDVLAGNAEAHRLYCRLGYRDYVVKLTKAL